VSDRRDWTLGGKAVLPYDPVPHEPTGAALAWWERDELFHTPGLFSGSRVPWWMRYRLAPIASGVGSTTMIQRKVPAFDTSTETMDMLLRHTPPRRVIAALAGWHHLGAKQLAAFIGYPHRNIGRYLKPLFDAGLVERGAYPKQDMLWRTNYLYRLRIDRPLRNFMSQISETDRRRITAGEEVGAGGQPVRHNLLAAELALRAAELVPGTVAVFPETVSTPARLLGHLGYTDTWRADFTIVRADGLRIVVELTRARRRTGIEEKMARWARILSRHHWNETGVVVVFVNAAVPNEGGIADTRAEHKWLAGQMRRAYNNVLSVDGLSDSAGKALTRNVELARAQIHLASWMDWFPAGRDTNQPFVDLSTVFAAREGEWQRQGLANPAGFWQFKPAPALAERVDAPARARRDVYACPRFLSDADAAATPVSL